jgi:hypothetical protein
LEKHHTVQSRDREGAGQKIGRNEYTVVLQWSGKLFLNDCVMSQRITIDESSHDGSAAIHGGSFMNEGPPLNHDKF